MEIKQRYCEKHDKRAELAICLDNKCNGKSICCSTCFKDDHKQCSGKKMFLFKEMEKLIKVHRLKNKKNMKEKLIDFIKKQKKLLNITFDIMIKEIELAFGNFEKIDLTEEQKLILIKRNCSFKLKKKNKLKMMPTVDFLERKDLLKNVEHFKDKLCQSVNNYDEILKGIFINDIGMGWRAFPGVKVFRHEKGFMVEKICDRNFGDEYAFFELPKNKTTKVSVAVNNGTSVEKGTHYGFGQQKRLFDKSIFSEYSKAKNMEFISYNSAFDHQFENGKIIYDYTYDKKNEVVFMYSAKHEDIIDHYFFVKPTSKGSSLYVEFQKTNNEFDI